MPPPLQLRILRASFWLTALIFLLPLTLSCLGQLSFLYYVGLVILQPFLFLCLYGVKRFFNMLPYSRKHWIISMAIFWLLLLGNYTMLVLGIILSHAMLKIV